MKIREDVQIFKYLAGARIIGIGSTAICFLLTDGRVLKLYYNIYIKGLIFNNCDIVSHFLDINSISNDTYIGPDEILINKDSVIGYIYPYVDAKTLYYSRYFISLNEIINKYPKLYEDTKKISQKNFILRDVHDKNILVKSIFYIIDLDYGYINEDLSKKDIFYDNMKKINKIIIYSLFNVNDDELIDFKDDTINDLWHNSIYLHPESFLELLEKLQEQCYPKKTSILNLRKSVPYNKSYNSYYRYF